MMAARAWKRLNIDADSQLLKGILAGLDRWRRSAEWAKEDGRFVPFPERFLKERRWEELPKEYASPGEERTRRNVEAITSALEFVGVQAAFGRDDMEAMTKS